MAGGRRPTQMVVLVERSLVRGRSVWHALQVGAAIAIGQIGTPADGGRPLRDPYPIVRIAEEGVEGIDPRERLGRMVLTHPLDLTRRTEIGPGMPGDAPN